MPEFCLFLSGNKFWYSVGETKMKAFRCYFDLNDVLTEVENASARIGFNITDKEETGIRDNNRVTTTDDRYYDLQGRRVHTSGSIMKKGLYIRNGKKELVR